MLVTLSLCNNEHVDRLFRFTPGWYTHNINQGHGLPFVQKHHKISNHPINCYTYRTVTQIRLMKTNVSDVMVNNAWCSQINLIMNLTTKNLAF